MNQHQVIFDLDLINRYNVSGPRYTSYPTAVQFHDGFREQQFIEEARRSNEPPLKPLSLYFHIPFCNTVCFYCGCNKIATKNRDRAAPYLQRLFLEIKMQGALFDRKRVVDQLHWGGGTPTFISHEEMRSLMAKTREHFSLHSDDSGEYSIEIDPREVRKDTINLLRELGFNRMSFGVQDFDPKVQQAVNRIQPPEMTASALEQARTAGFRSINLDLIYGLPFQSVDSFSRTLDQVIAYSPDRLSVFNYAHLPKMFKPQRRINEIDLPPASQKLAILEMTIEKLSQAGYVYIGMDHFAKPDDELAIAQRQGTLYRNFQGYSTHADCDVVGMGITAISRVGNSYSQNAKTEQDYYREIDNGHLAIIRGIQLSADDRLRRAVIRQLICHFELTLSDIEKAHQINFREYFAGELEQLAQMQQDGLVEIGANAIRVTPVGKLLVRNVCMVFDHYLRIRDNQFSKVI
ncbi:MAG: oxygen-independent coproporphyrinogen III oxidase [Gammaproteobacteria bacterium]|nr:oxygen-independent coproporphyrinogen III oxidase [Gammaproteobacteria bacterium]